MRYLTTIQTRRRGLTLVELVTAMALVGVLTVVVGTLLVSSNKHWNALFNKVYRQETTDSFAAHRVFDSVCRKSSYRKAILGQDNASLELYYWDTDSASETPDHYARFYLLDSDVMVEYGKNNPKPGRRIPTSRQEVWWRRPGLTVCILRCRVHRYR